MEDTLDALDLITIPESPEWLASFTYGIQENHKKPLPYRLHVPEAKEGKLPLVIYYHGIRGRGEDNENQMRAGNRFGPAYFSLPELQAQFPCYVLAPQCARTKYWVNFTRNTSSKQLRKSVKLIQSLLAHHAIDPERIYLVGQSMGGFAAWALLLEFPDLFAGAVVISGGGNARRARYKLSAPVWSFHGGQDPLVGVWRSRQMSETLKRAGKSFRYTELPDGKHDIWPQVFDSAEVAHWLFGQRRAKR